MKTKTRPSTAFDADWRSLTRATVGKDILELLSSSMYIDPLTIYREYVQNAADAIDEARENGSLLGNVGTIAISIDHTRRSIRIRDNGIGVRHENFESQLGTFGASLKRGSDRRGFRGVGRLAGLGYCQELIFRTRPVGENSVSEMRWDCRKIKSLLHQNETRFTLDELLRQVVTIRRIVTSVDMPHSFFEVELVGVVRHKNDLLLNEISLYDYLSEIAPVPFHPEFTFREEIERHLDGRVATGNVGISISGIDQPVYRSYRDMICVNGSTYDTLRDLEVHEIPANDDGVAAVMWILNHDYKGTVPDRRMRGLRMRCGNIQIGSSDILAEHFPEPRFNSWSVGELHVIDKRIIPNGRRDHFEVGVHFDNLTNHVAPLARKIAARCRKSSQARNRLQSFDRMEQTASEKLEILKQNLLGAPQFDSVITSLKSLIEEMKRISESPFLEVDVCSNLRDRVELLFRQADITRKETPDVLRSLPAHERKLYRKVFGLLYECAENDNSAKNLVDRVLEKLQSAE